MAKYNLVHWVGECNNKLQRARRVSRDTWFDKHSNTLLTCKLSRCAPQYTLTCELTRCAPQYTLTCELTRCAPQYTLTCELTRCAPQYTLTCELTRCAPQYTLTCELTRCAPQYTLTCELTRYAPQYTLTCELTTHALQYSLKCDPPGPLCSQPVPAQFWWCAPWWSPGRLCWWPDRTRRWQAERRWSPASPSSPPPPWTAPCHRPALSAPTVSEKDDHDGNNAWDNKHSISGAPSLDKSSALQDWKLSEACCHQN